MAGSNTNSVNSGSGSVFQNMSSENLTKLKAGIQAAKFGADILNANANYNETIATSRANIAIAQNNINDAIYRGREAQLARESEGIRAAGQASLGLAAQGIDVNGALGQQIAGSFEAVGALNGAKELINSYREALGYEIQQVNDEYAMEMAGINRDTQYFNAALNFGGGMAAAFK